MNKLMTDDNGRVWIITDRAVNIVAPDGSWTTLTKDDNDIWLETQLDQINQIGL